ncbi:BadF/BadG/BcrA/BcrD ATPase family protein [Humibacter albus]|uniref:BadF/BadG/BcrA/BcrD ATPase family protein n=1 Tax=Humibacter albus TaxID=427754 RepID=UPI0003B444EE|nr:BadF/BadG/BcrA/BcrD ATPase family protein [Humibacter albus]
MNTRAAADRLVGVDVGGTKTHLAAVDARGDRRDVILPSSQWRRGHLFSDRQNLPRLAEWIAAHASVDAATAVAIGLRDCDTDADLERARRELARRLGGSLRIENDADLLAPAAGHEHAIAMIVGTGAIVSARDAHGRRITADGHGWLFGDWGSGPALVRDAITRVLIALDASPSAAEDPLVPELLARFGADSAAELSAAATIAADPAHWGSAAAGVFTAAAAGSTLAADTISAAADRLAASVAAVSRRGGLGDVVVAAGGVIVNQPVLYEAVARRLRGMPRPLELELLGVAPVEGALALAEEQQQNGNAREQSPQRR